jgi:hypothetical protein
MTAVNRSNSGPWLILAALVLASAGWLGWVGYQENLRQQPFAGFSVEEMSTTGVMTVYSLEPEPQMPEQVQKSKPHSHHWLEIGHAPLDDPAERETVLRELVANIEAGRGFTAVACFLPRHGIRWTDGENEIDLVICFQCSQVVRHGNRRGNSFVISDSKLEPILDRHLTEAGVPLAPKAGRE